MFLVLHVLSKFVFNLSNIKNRFVADGAKNNKTTPFVVIF